MNPTPEPRRPKGNPAPRPALRKADDADVHPAVPRSGADEIVSLHGTTADAVRTGGSGSGRTRRAATPAPAPAPGRAPRAPAAAARPAAARPAGATPAQPARKPTSPGASQPLPPGDLHGRRGAVTSDTIRGRKDKPVDLKAVVPKSLRQEVRDLAKRDGRSVDDVVTALLRDGLSRARTK